MLVYECQVESLVKTIIREYRSLHIIAMFYELRKFILYMCTAYIGSILIGSFTHTCNSNWRRVSDLICSLALYSSAFSALFSDCKSQAKASRHAVLSTPASSRRPATKDSNLLFQPNRCGIHLILGCDATVMEKVAAATDAGFRIQLSARTKTQFESHSYHCNPFSKLEWLLHQQYQMPLCHPALMLFVQPQVTRSLLLCPFRDETSELRGTDRQRNGHGLQKCLFWCIFAPLILTLRHPAASHHCAASIQSLHDCVVLHRLPMFYSLCEVLL